MERWTLMLPLFGGGGSNMDGFPDLRTTAQQRGANCRIRDSWLSSSPSRCEPSPGWTWHPGPWLKERPAFLCGRFHGDSHTAWNLWGLSPRAVPQETVGLLAWRRRSPEQPTGGAGWSHQGGRVQVKMETNKPRAPLHDKSLNTISYWEENAE